MLISTERRYEITRYLSVALLVGLIFGCTVTLAFFTEQHLKTWNDWI